jgi:bifunctional UDP-N-acetylglucosamine pyrophosphorylase/glucosamine-1-phosphate N-acetyltransferase
MPDVTVQSPAAIILAAGKGTRMKSDLPKVVHPVGGRPMVCAVVDACRRAGCDPVVAVVGYRQELVRGALAGSGVVFAVQEPQLGTGHAVQSAREALGSSERDVFVLCGDGPLIRPETLRALLDRHRASGASATLATAVIDEPAGYGRIVRDGHGRFVRIVEHANATSAERALREVNPSYYCFRSGDLFAALCDVPRNEVSGEYYLTDVLSLLLERGRRVEVVPSVPPEDVLSINTPEDLAMVDAVYRRRRPSAEPVRVSR